MNMSASQSMSLLPPRGSSEEILVPFNKDKFRRYQGMQSIVAAVGIGMSLVACAFPSLALYGMYVDPVHRSQWMPVLWLSAFLILIVGSAAWPVLHQAKTATAIGKQNLPALIINRDGVWDYGSNYIFGFVSWNEIESVIVTSRHSRDLNKDFPGIAFVVKNKNALLRRKPELTRFWLNIDPEIANKRQIFVPQGRIETPIGDLLKQIDSLRPR
jgi:hypothetical protein